MSHNRSTCRLMSPCPCGYSSDYLTCCGAYLISEKIASSPEALMRSRYTAYTLCDLDYIQKTMKGVALQSFNRLEAERWTKRVTWLKLNVNFVEQCSEYEGYVEFEAFFIEGQRLKSIHEKSEFLQENGRWYYITGIFLPASHASPIISRQTLCPCGSLKKFKNCHGVSSR